MSTQQITKHYSQAIRQKALEDIESGTYTKSQAAKVYGVTPATIHHWIKQANKHQLLNKVIRIQMPNELDTIKRLEREKRELESALAQATLKIITLESTIKVFEEEAGVRIKKSTAIASLSTASKTSDATKDNTR